MLVLLGLLVVAVGFALRWNTLLVVVLAALVSGRLAGFPLHEVVAMLGEYFVANRFMILPIVLLVPVVGLLERHGLQQRVAGLMQRGRRASAGRVLWWYQAVRAATSTIGLSIGNHASMVRPLVAPMAEGAAGEKTAQPAIRAHAAAAENVGNFFADDLIVAVSALLLILGFFETVGVEVSLADLKFWSAPVAVWAAIVGWWRYRWLDRTLRAHRRSSHSP